MPVVPIVTARKEGRHRLHQAEAILGFDIEAIVQRRVARDHLRARTVERRLRRIPSIHEVHRDRHPRAGETADLLIQLLNQGRIEGIDLSIIAVADTRAEKLCGCDRDKRMLDPEVDGVIEDVRVYQQSLLPSVQGR